MRHFYLNDHSSDCFSESEDESNDVIIEINKLETENKYFINLEKIDFYKKKLELEPEFIGLKNVSSAILFEMVNSINQETYMDVRKLVCTENTKKILNDMFYELVGEPLDEHRQKILVKKIYNRCYC